MKTLKPEKNTLDVKALIDANQRILGFQTLSDLFLEQPESVGSLVEIATSKEVYPYPQYASWLLLHVSRKNSSLVEPFYNLLIDGILESKNPSVLRNLLGASLCLPLREYKQGSFLDRLIALISDYDSKPGVIVYSIRKLTEFMKLYPELKQEIVTILEFREETNLSPGILVWTRNILRKK
jgi:hypothetical protein